MSSGPVSVRTEKLVGLLGYAGTNGFALAQSFVELGSHRAALASAILRMQVVAAFGLRPGHDTARFKPLVLIAEAESDDDVVDLHRRAWSQGIAPYYLVVTPHSVWRCSGFAFSSDLADTTTRVRIEWDLGDTWPTKDLVGLTARSLRSRVTWRDYSINEGGVDATLLKNLGSLSDILVHGKTGLNKLPISLAHALIGRMIYIYMLVDRGILNETWFEHFELDQRAIADAQTPWPVGRFFELNARLDLVFNGTIFPLQDEADRIQSSHLEFLRSAIRLGRARSEGAIQLELFEIDLGSIRIETLSAVYELFLTKTDPDRKRTDGAFYTRPFLADYMLDAVEDHRRLDSNVRLLDPACGSGVFLVGAYRRKIENVLKDEERSTLSADRLRGILRAGLFGAELGYEACSVAAFSLYLTMLDYLSKDELIEYSLGHRGPCDRLFPPLIGENLIVGDFFLNQEAFYDRAPVAGPLTPPDQEVFRGQFDVVVGNPPWGNALNSDAEGLVEAAKRWQPCVENAQAAQVFVLEALKNHLVDGGVASFLLPASSFGNDKAAAFRSVVTVYRLLNVTNLAPFRRELFTEAEQAAAILTVAKGRTTEDHIVRFDCPTAISQPVKRRTTAWTLVVDPGESVGVPQRELGEDSAWIRSINGRSIDRLIMKYVDARIARKRFATLGSLSPQLVVKLGAEDRYSGVPEEFTITTNRKAVWSYERFVGSKAVLEFDDLTSGYNLPADVYDKIKGKYRSLFLNDVVLVPRKQAAAVLVTKPVAFNTTIIGIGLQKPDQPLGGDLLRAVTRFLNSRWARYFLTLHAPSAINDRPRLSLEDCRSLPMPFRSADDPRLQSFLERSDSDLDGACFELLGIDDEFRAAIDEFLDYRCLFANAKVPDDAFAVPDEDAYRTYLQTLRRRLIGTGGPGPEVQYRDPLRNITLVQTSLDPSRPSESRDFEPALRSYDRNAGAAFEDSLFVWRDPDAARLVLMKPSEAHHWKIAQAFIDADRVAEEILRAPQ